MFDLSDGKWQRITQINGLIPNAIERDAAGAEGCTVIMTAPHNSRRFIKPSAEQLEMAAKRKLFEEKKAVGVEYEQGGKTHIARAKEIILCGGAINSPQLLQLSGVGNARELAVRQRRSLRSTIKSRNAFHNRRRLLGEVLSLPEIRSPIHDCLSKPPRAPDRPHKDHQAVACP